MVADKVGLEILQCGIDYYNNTKTYDAPKKAIVLMRYALSIVVGQMAKERCKENVNIVKKAVDNMLPEIVREEAEAIEQELQKFYKLPELICHAVTMLNSVKPHLQSIKTKLGATNPSYLKLSTRVVKDAIYNVVQEVNFIQKKDPSNVFAIERTVRDAWNAMRIMDSFDKEEAFKIKYNENRDILEDICYVYDVPTKTKKTESSSDTGYFGDTRINCAKRLSREEMEEEERKQREEKTRKKKLSRGINILVVFAIIFLILALTVGPVFFAFMICGE